MENRDDDLSDFGSNTSGLEGGNEEISLIQDLERELGAVVQRHRIPPDELQQLFEVVQRMFNLMDSHREEYERIEAERNELDERWKVEKDNLRKMQTHKLELESQLEGEKATIELEKLDLEKKNAVLETKVKQLGEQKQYMEQELQYLKDRAARDEKARQEIIEQYKKQIESASAQQSQVVLHRMLSPLIPRQPIVDLLKRRQLSASLGASVSNLQPLEYSVESDVFMIGSMEVPLEEPPTEEQDEIEVKEAEKILQLQQNLPRRASPPSGMSLDNEFQQLEQEKEREEEERRKREEELRIQEEMMAEVEMMQKEKENWEEERKTLEQDRVDAIAQREAMEQHTAELQVEHKRLSEAHEELKERLSKVVKERDEVYDNYLKQPLSAYNISRKELHNLLMKQQATASELDSQRDQTLKYQQLYVESRKSYYDRFKDKMWKLFSKQSASNAEIVRYTTKETPPSNSLSPSSTLVTPLCHSIAVLLDEGTLTVDKGWLMSSKTTVLSNKLPQWMGQIPLKSVLIERIESVELGRIYHSQLDEQKGEAQLQSGLHAEVWVTTKEKSMSVACVNIEVIDVLSMPPKVCQRFILKPETPHIVCMKSIPGIIEEATSVDWTSSDALSSSSDSQRKPSDGVPSKSGSLEHGAAAVVLTSTAELDQLTTTLPTISAADTCQVPASDRDFDESLSDDEGHKLLSQSLLKCEEQKPDKIMTSEEKLSEVADNNIVEAEPPHASDRPHQRKHTDAQTPPVMWIITENNMLCFYPTTDPRHRTLNNVKLESRATCMEYLHGKVFIGHEASTISIYCRNESTFYWDLDNPQIITLPSHNPEVQNDVRCIAAVKDRLWVGAGPSIFFLSAENLECEGSRFLNVEHFPPELILPLNDVVAVSAKGSSVFIFDAETTNFLKTFDVYPMTKNLVTVEQNSKWKEVRSPQLEKIPAIIKTMVRDEAMLYLGTSQGMVVAVPISTLSKDSATTVSKPEIKEEERETGRTVVVKDADCLDNCALALHVQKDSRVKSLLYLQLPILQAPPSSESAPSREADQHNHPESDRQTDTSLAAGNTGLPLTCYRSLILSAGKGHMEYSDDPDAEDTLQLPPNYNSLREKNEEHQLLLWGHKL